MQNASLSDDDVALVYLRLVRQENPDAADLIEQIYVHFSVRAALRAALIITLLKKEIEHYHTIPEIGMYTYLLKDSPEAIPLLEDAITRCLECWGIPQTDKSGWEKWRRTPQAQSDTPREPFEDLLQQVCLHSPITAMKLEQIYTTYGYTAGCYGATALIWLEARVELFGHHILMELSDKDIREFSYFEYMGQNEEALGQFIEMIDCYCSEHRTVQFATAIPR